MSKPDRHNERWAPFEDAVLRVEVGNKKSLGDIAEAHQRTISAIINRIEQNGLAMMASYMDVFATYKHAPTDEPHKPSYWLRLAIDDTARQGTEKAQKEVEILSTILEGRRNIERASEAKKSITEPRCGVSRSNLLGHDNHGNLFIKVPTDYRPFATVTNLERVMLNTAHTVDRVQHVLGCSKHDAKSYIQAVVWGAPLDVAMHHIHRRVK